MLVAAQDVTQATGKDFQIMFGPRFSIKDLTVEALTTKLAHIFDTFRDHPNLYREDGVITISGYLDDQYSAAEWSAVIQGIKDSTGLDLAVLGHLQPNKEYALGITPEGESKIRDYAAVWQGVTIFYSKPKARATRGCLQRHQADSGICGWTVHAPGAPRLL